MTTFEVKGVITLDAAEFYATLKAAKEAAEAFTQASGGVSGAIGDAANALDSNEISKGVAKGKALYNSLTGIVKGVWNFGENIVNVSADVAAENEQFASTLRDLQDEATAIFDVIGEMNNIMPIRLRDEGVKFYTQFLSSSGDEEEALKGMAVALTLASDAAAEYNISLEEAGYMLRSFIRGNVEAGERIGLSTSGTEREYLGIELFYDKWVNLSDWERQQVFLISALKSYDIANITGQASREQKTWGNIVGNFTAAWGLAEASMGDALRENLTPQIARLTDWVNSNPELFESIGETLGNIVGAGIDLLMSFSLWLTENGQWIIDGIEELSKFFAPKVDLSALEGYSMEQYALLSQYIAEWNKNGEEAANEIADMLMETRNEEGTYGTGLLQAYHAVKWAIDEIPEDEKLPELPVEVLPADGTKIDLERILASMGINIPVIITPIISWASDFLSNALSNAREAYEEAKIVEVPRSIFDESYVTQSEFDEMVRETREAVDGSQATGLSYVPYDGYVAELHRGERVMTALQNANYSRAQEEPEDNTQRTYMRDLLDEFRSFVNGLAVQMDGKTVGTIVAPTVFREMGRQVNTRRYT